MPLLYRSILLAGPRGHSQDCLLEPIHTNGAWWCAIADGLGGVEQGDTASQTCIFALRRTLRSSPSMKEAYAFVSRSLAYKVKMRSLKPNMGSTLSVLKLVGFEAYVGHVGDTRITHYRGGGVMTRTHDQTEVQKLVDDGVISKYQARRYPRRNVVMSVMSPRSEYDLFVNRFTVEVGDRILLTSDGFHSQIKKGIISRISVECTAFSTFFQKIEDEILGVSLTDDASCLAIEVV